MANLVRHHFGWVGTGFHPGVEHVWRFGPISFGVVVYATAHPVQLIPRETMVKDFRVHVDGAGNRSFLCTVRNTGANTINGYGMDFSVVSN